jgi:hypothetical protein
MTDKQKEALEILKEEKALPIDSCKVNKNTINSLYFKGLVKSTRYANGVFLELTDKGRANTLLWHS